MLTENNLDLLVWVIKLYLLGTILFQQLRVTQKAGQKEMEVEGLVKMRTTMVICAFLLGGIWLFLENLSLLVLGVIMTIYLIQPRRIHDNGINLKGVFYEWDRIEKVVLLERSTSLRIYLKQRDFFLRKMLILPFLPQQREEVLKKIKRKPVSFEGPGKGKK